MQRYLMISVRHHDERHHAEGCDPIGAARLFQAIVAGVGASGPLGAAACRSLRWLETLPAPIVAAPHITYGQRVKVFLPNNDLDKVGGDPRRIAVVRKATQNIQPRMYQADVAFLYAWSLPEGSEAEEQSEGICRLAESVYQFGRGVDMAWACGEVISEEELEAVLAGYQGQVHRPSGRSVKGGLTLSCPTLGSLESLTLRYSAGAHRFDIRKIAGSSETQFRNIPKARFVEVGYESPPHRQLYELHREQSEFKGHSGFFAWPLSGVVHLVEWVRNHVAERLRTALPQQVENIERFLIGRKVEGLERASANDRVRIVALPSTGHEHVDRSIRRIVVEVPGACPLRADDVFWAFSGMSKTDPDTGEVVGPTLIPASERKMALRYGIGSTATLWRTVTPIALPDSAQRRRIEPARQLAEAKAGRERIGEMKQASAAVVQALRHAGVAQRPSAVRLQREPFVAKGERAESFAKNTRFQKGRLWHAELRFSTELGGPLLVGDGRFLGLGLLEPVLHPEGLLVFQTREVISQTDPSVVARAFRRAVMARVQELLGNKALPAFFSGHGEDGAPLRSSEEGHLSFLCEPSGGRLIVVSPHVIERRSSRVVEANYLQLLSDALRGFSELRAGAAGLIHLSETSLSLTSDELMAPSRVWQTVTPYQVTRHARSRSAMAVFVENVKAECSRAGLPRVRVSGSDLKGVPKVGLVGQARLEFEVAIAGPISLGRSRFLGGGLFVGSGED